MAERLVNVDRETPMLLPVDLRDWVPEDDLVHFVISAVETMRLPSLSVNRRGTGSLQYPPVMMLSLLIYCYARGVFSSRRIERMTYRDIAVRYLTGDTHPDHDTICAFRRRNAVAVGEAFVEVLKLARELGFVAVGTVSVDGTHILANASKQKSVRYDRAGELVEKLKKDVAELLEQAERIDAEGEDDPAVLPKEIGRRERLQERLQEARRELERRAAEDDSDDDEPQSGSPSHEKEPPKVRDTKQINLTDPDSCIMRKSKRDSWQQAYNAQAVVDADGSQQVLGAYVIATPSDANQLEPAIASVDESIGKVQRVLADGGYVNSDVFKRLEQDVELYVAIADGEQNHRRYDFRPPKEKKSKSITNKRLLAMREKLSTDEGRHIYAHRAKTVEPVFGTIKAALGFRQFLLRGLAKVQIEWDLVCLAYNIKRVWSLANA
jgi:transposase